jgi:hypothetical protein
MFFELIIADNFTLVDTRRMIETHDHQEVISVVEFYLPKPMRRMLTYELW